MSFLGASQQHTLQHISELLVELRQLINTQTTYIMPTRFEQRSLTEEPPDSLDVRSPQLSTWHTRPPDESRQRRTLPRGSSNSPVQPPQPTVASSTRTWRPPPSRTTGEFVPTRVRIEAPLFNGDDPLGWIFGIQDYFNYFVTDESVRLAVVEKIIEQPALDWFHNYQKSDMKGSWEDFLVAVRYHFAPELTEEVDDEEQLSGSSLCAGIPDEVMDVDVVSQKFSRELVSDDVPSNVGAPSDRVFLSVASKLVTDSLFVTDPSDEAMESFPECENFPDEDECAKENSVGHVFEDKDGDDAIPSIEFVQIISDPLFVDVPSDVVVPNDGVVLSDVVIPNDGIFHDFPSDVVIPGYGIGAVEGIHIFDPGAGAFESLDSRAGENSSRLQRCPKIQDPKSYQVLLRREKVLASDARSIPPRKDVECSGRSFSMGRRLPPSQPPHPSSSFELLRNCMMDTDDDSLEFSGVVCRRCDPSYYTIYLEEGREYKLHEDEHGKDGVLLLWDLSEGKMLYSLEAGSIVTALTFSPNRYWLCAATESGIKIWDLESKSVVADLKVSCDVNIGDGLTDLKNFCQVRSMRSLTKFMVCVYASCLVVNSSHCGVSKLDEIDNHRKPVTAADTLLQQFLDLRLEDKANFIGGRVDRDLTLPYSSPSWSVHLFLDILSFKFRCNRRIVKLDQVVRQGAEMGQENSDSVELSQVKITDSGIAIRSHKFSCSSTCPFSEHGYSQSDSAQRSKPRCRVEPIPTRDVKSRGTTSHPITPLMFLIHDPP